MNVRVERTGGENVLYWKDDDDFEDCASSGDKISFVIGSCDEVTGVLMKLNPICFYVQLPRSDHEVPFPVRRITYIKKCLS